DSLITLTPLGMEIADRIYTRHKVLTDFLLKLGLDEQLAHDDACRLEHDMSDETFSAIRKHVESMK
ncbi:MAG: metal-dependent transcriptional regulator, partial [Oscillospiraceae bacterium]|nr:metal-dependent transcriptional regulator [Oscillospiraceae bacterium]